MGTAAMDIMCGREWLPGPKIADPDAWFKRQMGNGVDPG